MRFLSNLASSPVSGKTWKFQPPSSGFQIERQILETNPLLEAFGNARTLRNDNSSRFGKFIQLLFKRNSSESLVLTGARIETYLLEKIRVSSQQEGERNFHIFYQCCAAASACGSSVYPYPQLLKEGGSSFQISLSGFSDLADFAYLTSSSCSVLNGVDDVLEFERTVSAMRVIGISVSEIESIFKGLAAILHLGNIEFSEVYPEGACVSEGSQKSIKVAADLMGVGVDGLERAMIRKVVTAPGGDVFYQNFTVNKAMEARDALARHLYAKIFALIVERTNKSISAAGGNSNEKGETVFCGVLDIFGFEFFKQNTFEQFCINYTNERFQSLFTECVMKNEQAIYASDDVPFQSFDFPDNSAILSLLDHPNTGLLATLDEEARIVGGSDSNYLAKVNKVHCNHPSFTTIRHKTDQFKIDHFAGPVQYSVSGFVEKNKDYLSADLVALLPNWLGADPSDERSFGTFSSAEGGPRLKAKLYTVGGEFREQLKRLMAIIADTNNLFIRCIKPNPKNQPEFFDSNAVTEQLRYGGVLQAVQISRSGFPVRLKHAEFFADFGILLIFKGGKLLKEISRLSDQRAKILRLITALDSSFGLPRATTGRAPFAVGKTRVFMKQTVFDSLRSLRFFVRAKSSTRISAWFRGWLVRRFYKSIIAKAVSAGAVIRSCVIKRHFLRWLSIRKLQSFWRMIRVRRKWYKEIKARVEIARASGRDKGWRVQPMLISPSGDVEMYKIEEDVDVDRLRGNFAERRCRFEQENLAKNDSEDISKKMRDLQSELEVAKKALNHVEAQINSDKIPRARMKSGSFVVGQRGPLVRTPSYFDSVNLPGENAAALFSQRVIVQSQARLAETPRTDKIAHEEAEMKKLIGRIQSELAKQPVRR